MHTNGYQSSYSGTDSSTSYSSQTLLEVKHVSVDYDTARGPLHAVQDVSFTLKRGQIFGLAGESGSGKSTLAYAIARLLRPPAVITQGEVLFYRSRANDVDDEIDVFSLSPSQLRAFRWSELAIVFQSAMNALNPVISIEKQILDVLQVHDPGKRRSEYRERAVELLRLVGIASDRLRSFPHELSGGMRQRAIIAIALALNPEIIIMDEPTTALDVVVQREILRELMLLRESFNFSVIFITHDLSLLLEIADAVAIMYAGRLIETATQGELYHHPLHPYTNGLLNSFPTLHGPRRKLVGIPGSPPDLRTVPSGCAFHPRCSFAFPPCKTIVPALLSPNREKPDLRVACHLYDDNRNPAGPPAQLSAPFINTGQEQDKPLANVSLPSVEIPEGDAL
jgi:peptide/nickel transport system ATP-binding protein